MAPTGSHFGHYLNTNKFYPDLCVYRTKGHPTYRLGDDRDALFREYISFSAWDIAI